MKAVQTAFRAAARTFSTNAPKTVEEIFKQRQVQLGLVVPKKEDALLKIIRDRQEALAKENAPLSVDDCVATRRVVLGLEKFDNLTPKQQQAYEQYVTPSSTVLAGSPQDKGTVVAASQGKAR